MFAPVCVVIGALDVEPMQSSKHVDVHLSGNSGFRASLAVCSKDANVLRTGCRTSIHSPHPEHLRCCCCLNSLPILRMSRTFLQHWLQVPGSQHGRGMWSGRKDTGGDGPFTAQDLLEDALSCKGKQLDNVVACIEVRFLSGSRLTEKGDATV